MGDLPEGVQHLTGGDDVLVDEELLVEELSDAVLVKLNGGLGVGETKLTGGGEELSRHKETLVETVHVTALIAELC